MNLPVIQEVIVRDTVGGIDRSLFFDKVSVSFFGNAHRLQMKITFRVNENTSMEDICLEDYMRAVNVYFMSNPAYKKSEKGKYVNLFDFAYVKFIDFFHLKINRNVVNIIKNHYFNLLSMSIHNSSMDKDTYLRGVKCNVNMCGGEITSLDNLNGFEGEIIFLENTKVLSDNEHTLHLYAKMLKMINVSMNYERFFLTTDAPHLLKLEIREEKAENHLTHQDLLFIAGFYNLKSITIDGVVENYDQIRKLECLRELRYLLCTDQKEIEKTRKRRIKNLEEIRKLKEKKINIEHYLMFQTMALQEEHLDFFHKIHVPRLERVKWEDKIATKSVEKIKEELVSIGAMTREMRKNIARIKETHTFFEEFNGLCFEPKREEEYIERSADPFDFNSSSDKKYYVKNKKIIIEE